MSLPGTSRAFPRPRRASATLRSTWSRRASATLRPSLFAAALACTLCLSGCPHARGQGAAEALPLPTTDDPLAEASFQSARDAETRGDIEAARAGYQGFLTTYADDPLTPVAELRLGRIELSEGKVEEARARFERAAASEDVSIAERAELYLGVTLHLRGEHQEALTLLRPLEGRLVSPEENVLLMRTMSVACRALEDRACAVRALDGLLRGELPDAERAETAAELTALVRDEITPEEVVALYDALPHEGLGWSLVARRALRQAFSAGEMTQAARYAAALRENGVRLEGELLAMAERAERTGQADPQVIGAILPLSGRGREVGQHALRALMLAAGAPGDGPAAPGSVQIVVRDSGADPARAVRAVDDLVALHRVVAIVGPIDAGAAEQAARRAQELGVPLIALSPVPSVVDAGPMAFRLFSAPQVEVEELVRAATARGARRFAALFPTHGYGQAMRAALVDAAARAGAEVVAEVSYAPGATSFGREAQALASARPDAVLVPDRASQIALVAPALAAVGLWPGEPTSGGADAGPSRAGLPLLLVPSVGADPALLRPSARYLRGALFSVPFDSSSTTGPSAAFLSSYQGRYGEAPDVFAAYAYDAFFLVRAAVERGAVTRADLAAALPRTRAATVGPSGGFAETRQPANATRLMVFRDGALVPAPR
jgi:branched-chain amino acid transport system substrate-binding protein